ncbi:hypothetical protein [Kineococcus arenarius]|uniref:hypothetical protein n=1 Tax=Kineococcus sp. SYSU DK007 TaxID=3383128 RepID=UPI003D7E8B0A
MSWIAEVDWSSLGSGVIGAVVGGVASFWATVRTTRKTNAQAYTDMISNLGQAWMGSDNPELARMGAELVGGALRSMADDSHVPEKIRDVTSTIGDIETAIERGRNLEQSSGEPPDFTYDEDEGANGDDGEADDQGQQGSGEGRAG